ncbi:MAG: ATP-dependent helicase [Desulfobacterales bacterium]|nr:ATP-dependent helicase [Desulfobacterales bacterium]
MQQNLFPGELPHTPVTAERKACRVVSRAVLNEAQYQAVTSPGGPVLVIAGAGSGKTRTLVYRVAHLLEQGVEPERILLLTFTRKSAQEMLSRASLLLDSSCQRVIGGTFHAVAGMLLRRYGYHLGYPANFTIIDRADAEGIINILKSSLALSGAGKRFPFKRIIVNLISKSVNTSMNLDDLIYDEYSHLDEFVEDILRLRKHYQDFKLEHGLMDYDDLLVNWQRILKDIPGVREEIAGRYDHILVDEYQDTNSIQAEIVLCLGRDHTNVMAVGDDSQSIYSFRGADFNNIMGFPRLFPGTRVITLEENYRSTQQILDLTNAVISRAERKYTKALFSRIKGGNRPVVFAARDAAEEAGFVVREILALQEQGVAMNEIAVLFRSGFHSYKLEIELTAHRIGFEKRGGLKLTESAHIKDMLSFFRVLANPRDHLSWNRLLLLIEKIGPRTARKILAVMKRSDEPVAALSTYPAQGKGREGLLALAGLFIDLLGPELTPAARFDLVFDYYRPIFERVYQDDYPRRSKDIDQLKTIVSEYEDLEALVADTALDPPEPAGGALSGPDCLVLSTVHSAKGLEWDTVFIINLAEGQFPSSRVMPGPQLEEERRLLYVAATRAKQRLFCSYPRQVMSPDRKFSMATLTRFLAELDGGLFSSRTSAAPGLATAGPGQGIYRPRTAAPPSRPGSKLTMDQLVAGTRVRHPFFGPGRVETVIGSRSVNVLFDRHGQKTLHLDYARLELIK